MWLIIVLLLCLTTNNAEAKRDFVIELNEYRFNTTSSNYVKTLNYNLVQQKYITVEFSLKRPVNEFMLNYKFYMLKRDNKRVNIMSLKLDGCKALEAGYTVPLVAAITREVYRKSNLPKKCPVKQNELFYLRNFTFNEEDFPKVTPVMSFQTLTEFYFEKEYQGLLTLKGRIKKK